VVRSSAASDVYKRQGPARLDEEEFLDVFAAPLGELLEWVETGKITDVKTIISTYWLERRRRASSNS
jgi:ADP-ribose pyrophosphatase